MQSFRATYGWLGINITSRLLVSWERSSRSLIGTAKESSYVLHDDGTRNGHAKVG